MAEGDLVVVPEVPSDFTFCPDHDQCFMAVMMMMPPGTAFDNIEQSYDRGSLIRKFISGLALSWTHFEDAMCASLDEWFCSYSNLDFDMWKKDYGIPDECDLFNQSVCVKVQTGQTPTAEYLIYLLEASGFSSEGRWLTGSDVEFPGVRSTFRLFVDTNISPAFGLTSIINFQLGVGKVLGNPDTSNLSCMLERHVPAHCVVDVNISGQFVPTSLGVKLKIWYNADDTSNGDVLSWLDRKVNFAATGSAGATGNSAVQADGFRWVTFDGVNDYMVTATSSNPPSGTTASAIFVLFEQLDSADDKQIIIKTRTNSPTDDERRLATRMQRLGHNFSVAEGNTYELIDISEQNELIGPTVGVGIFQSTGLQGRIFGRATSPDEIVAPLSTPSPARITMGANAEGTPIDFAAMRLRHVIIVQDPAPHEIMQTEAWLAWNINKPDILDGSHPYRNIRP